MQYKFEDIYEIPQIREMSQRFSDLMGISSAIIGVDGTIWVKCNWQDICENYPAVSGLRIAVLNYDESMQSSCSLISASISKSSLRILILSSRTREILTRSLCSSWQ
ncbi:MAG: PocR ligand-binding domain-containing protein [Geobacteraceae bacterium]